MGSCGANRREFKDQSAIKGKIKSQKGIRPSWSLILESQKHRVKKKRGEEKK